MEGHFRGYPFAILAIPCRSCIHKADCLLDSQIQAPAPKSFLFAVDVFCFALVNRFAYVGRSVRKLYFMQVYDEMKAAIRTSVGACERVRYH
jgi:hypothetical protein